MSQLFPKQIDFLSLPIYENNQAAIAGGLEYGELYRTPGGIVKVVTNFSNLTLNLSSGYSYLGRAF